MTTSHFFPCLQPLQSFLHPHCGCCSILPIWAGHQHRWNHGPILGFHREHHKWKMMKSVGEKSSPYSNPSMVLFLLKYLLFWIRVSCWWSTDWSSCACDLWCQTGASSASEHFPDLIKGFFQVSPRCYGLLLVFLYLQFSVPCMSPGPQCTCGVYMQPGYQSWFPFPGTRWVLLMRLPISFPKQLSTSVLILPFLQTGMAVASVHGWDTDFH